MRRRESLERSQKKQTSRGQRGKTQKWDIKTPPWFQGPSLSTKLKELAKTKNDSWKLVMEGHTIWILEFYLPGELQGKSESARGRRLWRGWGMGTSNTLKTRRGLLQSVRSEKWLWYNVDVWKVKAGQSENRSRGKRAYFYFQAPHFSHLLDSHVS